MKKGEEEAEQKSRAEGELDAARKLAAARVEETARRLAQGSENAAEKLRATEIAAKLAKQCREKEQRRAEIYAINAVMRCAYFTVKC